MAYTPTRPRAQAALDALRPYQPEEWLSNLYLLADAADVRELITALVCATPCVGEVNETGWHKKCEKKVEAIMLMLDPLAVR